MSNYIKRVITQSERNRETRFVRRVIKKFYDENMAGKRRRAAPQRHGI